MLSSGEEEGASPIFESPKGEWSKRVELRVGEAQPQVAFLPMPPREVGQPASLLAIVSLPGIVQPKSVISPAEQRQPMVLDMPEISSA